MSLRPRAVNFNDAWGSLKGTVKDVITLDYVAPATWNQRFSDVYSICVAQPEPLANRLYEEIKEFLDNHVKSVHRHVVLQTENLLKAYHDEWLKYSRGVHYLDLLFQYLNQQHIKKSKISDADLSYGSCISLSPNEQMQEIGELGLEFWKNLMIKPLHSDIVSLILNEIKLDRLGKSEQQGPTVLHGVINSFVAVEQHKKKGNLTLYFEMFELPFLNATGEYYRKEATYLLENFSVSQYMEKVLNRIAEENLRCRKYLHPSSYSKVSAECEQSMVADHLSLLHSECKAMVSEERSKDLENLYNLLKSVVGGLQPLISEVQSHIQSVGQQMLPSVKGDSSHIIFVENALNVHSKYRQMIFNVFKGDQQFVSALDKACSAIVNFRIHPSPCQAPELLAKYCDSYLKKSIRVVAETEVDEKLSSSITIFKYLDDKDIFQKFYSRMLAKRLIHQLSHSMDMEEAMINRLKQACGYEFTNKLHRMFTDMSVSADLNEKFSQHLQSHKEELPIGFTINVLQAGAWPLMQGNTVQFSIPPQFEKSVQLFEKFYHSHYNGRKLTWLHHLCQVELRLCYLKRGYITLMQTFQMVICLAFENVDSYQYKDLLEATGLADDQFGKYLQSLVDFKILLADGELNSDTTISLNKEYSNRRTKFRITAVVQKESQQESDQTHYTADEDRKLYLQATIVRIMKSRKVLKHTALIQEVLTHCAQRFVPSVPMIKKCIESLIDKQYLERTPNSSDEYSYVA